MSDQTESVKVDFSRICYEFVFSKFDSNTELLSTNSFKLNVIFDRENKHSDVSCGVLFYCLIKFNQKILILSRFASINDFYYVIMTTELFIKYFCNIKLCCLWRFDDNISVIHLKCLVLKYCFIFIVLGPDTSTLGSIEWPQRCDSGVTGGRSLSIRSGQTGN